MCWKSYVETLIRPNCFSLDVFKPFWALSNVGAILKGENPLHIGAHCVYNGGHMFTWME